MAQYKEIKLDSGEILCIQRIDDDGSVWTIPNDPANSDYQAYLADET